MDLDASPASGPAAQRTEIDPAVWERPDMRYCLARRDIAGVYRLLQRVGVSQRAIAALTGQAQSEISEILGGRQVVSYDLLVRIADGLRRPARPDGPRVRRDHRRVRPGDGR